MPMTVNPMCVTGHKVFHCEYNSCDIKLLDICMWIPVTTAWHVLRLGIEVTANKLNK